MSRAIAIVWTTFPSEVLANEVARKLVEEGLVACGQVEATAIRSVYRWKGAVESATEFRVTLKVPVGGLDRLRVRLGELHPYEVPEFVVFDAKASEAYARWIDDCCP